MSDETDGLDQLLSRATLQSMIADLRAQNERLVDALLDATVQGCDWDPNTRVIDSGGFSAYADAIEVLARHGRVHITTAKGRRVIATVLPVEDTP